MIFWILFEWSGRGGSETLRALPLFLCVNAPTAQVLKKSGTPRTGSWCYRSSRAQWVQLNLHEQTENPFLQHKSDPTESVRNDFSLFNRIFMTLSSAFLCLYQHNFTSVQTFGPEFILQQEPKDPDRSNLKKEKIKCVTPE